MFEKFNNGGRRVIFYARHEASMAGQREIDSKSLVLGILTQYPDFTKGLLWEGKTLEQLRKSLQGVKVANPSVIDLPLSNLAKLTLIRTIGIAGSFAHRFIGGEHILRALFDDIEVKAAMSEFLIKEKLIKYLSESGSGFVEY